jgi:mono/diheme cytochrome c family protein
MRLVLAALTVLVLGGAIAGVGMGEAPAERRAAARQRIAAGGAATARGRALFAAEGCDRCHSIAATGAEGKLGPRLDAIDEDAEKIAEAIVDPREETAGGFPATLMPADFGDRLSDAQVADLAAFVAAASGGEGGGESGKDGGRGRGRGESSGHGRGGDDG